jgi:hypothetical protein
LVLYLFKSILVYHDRHRKSDRQAFLVLVEFLSGYLIW